MELNNAVQPTETQKTITSAWAERLRHFRGWSDALRILLAAKLYSEQKPVKLLSNLFQIEGIRLLKKEKKYWLIIGLSGSCGSRGLVCSHIGLSGAALSCWLTVTPFILNTTFTPVTADMPEWFLARKVTGCLISAAYYMWVCAGRSCTPSEVSKWSRRWPGGTCANIQRSADPGWLPSTAMDEKLPGSWIKNKLRLLQLVTVMMEIHKKGRAEFFLLWDTVSVWKRPSLSFFFIQNIQA